MTSKFVLVMTLVLSRCVCDCVTEVRTLGWPVRRLPLPSKKLGESLSPRFFLGVGVVCKQATPGNYRKKSDFNRRTIPRKYQRHKLNA